MKNKLIIGTLCAVVLLGAGCNRYEKNPTLGTLPSLAREYSDKEMQLREDDNYDEKQQKLAAKYNKKMQCEWESIRHNPIAFRCSDGLPYKVDSVVIKEVGLYVFSISVYMEITKVLKRQLGEWEAGDISSSTAQYIILIMSVLNCLNIPIPMSLATPNLPSDSIS